MKAVEDTSCVPAENAQNRQSLGRRAVTGFAPHGVQSAALGGNTAKGSACCASCILPANLGVHIKRISIADMPIGRLVLLSLLLVSACSQPQSYTLEIVGAKEDRPIAVAIFDLPSRAKKVEWRAHTADGTIVPVQVGADGTGTLILENVAAGEVHNLTLIQEEASRGVTIRHQAGMVSFSARGRPVVAYHSSRQPLPRDDIDSIYHRSGYLHPVYTPTGRMVTDDYPPNHIHHHGIWSAWTRTAFMGRNPDFWNMGSRTGTVEHVAVDSLWEGPVHGGLKARHVQVDLTGEGPIAALDELWQVRVYNAPGVHLFDLAVRQETASDSMLHLLEHRYGGVGLRGARAWNGPDSAEFLTSEGLTRMDAHATRARWCHIGGLVDGEKVGITVLGHPDNHEAPQPMRIHPDEPFFNYAPSQAGDFAVRPGEAYQMRYRYVVYDGDPDAALLDALWQDYAFPLVGTVSR